MYVENYYLAATRSSTEYLVLKELGEVKLRVIDNISTSHLDLIRLIKSLEQDLDVEPVTTSEALEVINNHNKALVDKTESIHKIFVIDL